MGTHPIFESDFDCLTEKMEEILSSIMRYCEESGFEETAEEIREQFGDILLTQRIDINDVFGQHFQEKEKKSERPKFVFKLDKSRSDLRKRLSKMDSKPENFEKTKKEKKKKKKKKKKKS